MSHAVASSPRFLMPDPSRFSADFAEAKAELSVTFQRILLYLKTCARGNQRLEDFYPNLEPRMVSELQAIWPEFAPASVAELSELPGPEFERGKHRVNEEAPAPEAFQGYKMRQPLPRGFKPGLGKVISYSALNLRAYTEHPIFDVDIPLLNFAELIDQLFGSEIEGYLRSLLPD